MKIYTKAGDKGTTVSFDQTPTSKSSSRIEAIGSIDELNSYLGIVVAHLDGQAVSRSIEIVQKELFAVGAYLSSNDVSHIEHISVDRLERQIDDWTDSLPVLRNFILPGGSVVGSQLHYARTICRRAERMIVTYHEDNTVAEPVLQYINRLSDWLFTLARYINVQQGAVEKKWESDH